MITFPRIGRFEVVTLTQQASLIWSAYCERDHGTPGGVCATVTHMPDLTLDIYLDQNCFGCDQAESLAAEIDGWFPQVRVVIHWLSNELRLPKDVVAVPAFLLEGRLIQYGTPERQQITDAVRRALGADGGQAVT